MIAITPTKLFLTAFVFLAVGCKDQKIPEFVDEMITSHKQSSIRAIWGFQFNGEAVYYVQKGCCDIYNDLYTSQGERICSPDGGITGSGDGKCPTFWESAKDQTRIWEESRESPRNLP